MVTATSKKFLIGFGFMDTPGFCNGVNLFLRGFGVIRGIVSRGWRGARNFRVRRIIRKSGSDRFRGVAFVSVAGSDLFIFSIDRSPCVHGGLGAMPVARWGTGIERPVVVEHYVNSRVRNVKNDQTEKDSTWTDTSKVKTINDISMHGTLLAFGAVGFCFIGWSRV
jgi:hypothetical protein